MRRNLIIIIREIPTSGVRNFNAGTGADEMSGRFFTVKMLIRAAFTALSLANIGVAHAGPFSSADNLAASMEPAAR